jgi:MFS family permease
MTKTQRFTLAATGLGLFMIYLDALIVNVALPAIQSDFKVGEAGLQWVVTAYSLGMAIAMMSAGTAADIYGLRKLLGGIALFTAASAACGMAFSLEVLNLARAVQGVAAAAANVTSLASSALRFPIRSRRLGRSVSGPRSQALPWGSARRSAASWCSRQAGARSSWSTFPSGSSSWP